MDKADFVTLHNEIRGLLNEDTLQTETIKTKIQQLKSNFQTCQGTPDAGDVDAKDIEKDEFDYILASYELALMGQEDHDDVKDENDFTSMCLTHLASSTPTPFCWINKIYSPICTVEKPFLKKFNCYETNEKKGTHVEATCQTGDSKTLLFNKCKAVNLCQKINYVSCGGLACARQEVDCVTNVGKIALKSGKGLLKLTAFIMSFGTSTVVVKAVDIIDKFYSIIKKLNSAWTVTTVVLNNFFKATSVTLNHDLKDKIIALAFKKVKAECAKRKITKSDTEITTKLTAVFANYDTVKAALDEQTTKFQQAITAIKAKIRGV